MGGPSADYVVQEKYTQSVLVLYKDPRIVHLEPQFQWLWNDGPRHCTVHHDVQELYPP